MPAVPFVADKPWPRGKGALMFFGVRRMREFCAANGVPAPAVTEVPPADWPFGACAYYRPDTEFHRRVGLRGHGPGINVCLPKCGTPCDPAPSRNWSWPASAVDREPFGVVLHELGHHLDWTAGERKGRYYSEYCEKVKDTAREPGLTSYADENPAEWLAEALRLFVANHGLLKCLRPRTHAVLCERWRPVGTGDWRAALGPDVPARVVKSLHNKGAT